MPALAMAIVYFGYIARITRAGVIDALDADYSRTAVMKGLPPRTVMRRHVLRNALGPTISVIGVQIGYLFGGIIGVEKVFNYHGLGSDDAQRGRQPRSPGATGGGARSSASSTCSPP